MKRVQLTADTVGPVARGHPWVYPDGLKGQVVLGELVELFDPRGKSVGFGIGDEGAIAVRVLGRIPEAMGTLLRSRLAAAVARRSLLGGQTDAYRICNGEGDGLPGIVLDRYGDVYVLRLYSKAWERHLSGLVEAIIETVRPRTLFRRLGVATVDDRQGGELLRGPAPAEVVTVTEHGIKLLVRVRDGQKTGMFLDQREHRRLVRGWSAGRQVVNLFAYNGGFSISAALGGAKRVITVDIAAPALEDAKEIFRINGVDPGAHGFEAVDAFAWPGPKSDLVIVDPPSLTKGKAADGAARLAYKSLHRHVTDYATDLVATASCTARLPWERWEEAVREGLGGTWSSLHRSAEPVDHPVAMGHPEGRYLKFMLLGRLGAHRNS